MTGRERRKSRVERNEQNTNDQACACVWARVGQLAVKYPFPFGVCTSSKFAIDDVCPMEADYKHFFTNFSRRAPKLKSSRKFLSNFTGVKVLCYIKVRLNSIVELAEIVHKKVPSSVGDQVRVARRVF